MREMRSQPFTLVSVGATGFEPATARRSAESSTGVHPSRTVLSPGLAGSTVRAEEQVSRAKNDDKVTVDHARPRSLGQRLTDTAMTLADAHRLEQTVQDRAWLYSSGVFADDLRTEIETGVSVLDFDQEGVSRFSRRYLLDREDRKAAQR